MAFIILIIRRALLRAVTRPTCSLSLSFLMTAKGSQFFAVKPRKLKLWASLA